MNARSLFYSLKPSNRAHLVDFRRTRGHALARAARALPTAAAAAAATVATAAARARCERVSVFCLHSLVRVAGAFFGKRQRQAAAAAATAGSGNGGDKRARKPRKEAVLKYVSARARVERGAAGCSLFLASETRDCVRYCSRAAAFRHTTQQKKKSSPLVEKSARVFALAQFLLLVVFVCVRARELLAGRRHLSSLCFASMCASPYFCAMRSQINNRAHKTADWLAGLPASCLLAATARSRTQNIESNANEQNFCAHRSPAHKQQMTQAESCVRLLAAVAAAGNHRAL